MLKIQELEIDGSVYRLREPRIRDYKAGQGKEGIDASCAMLGGMLLDEHGKEIGEEAAYDLPLAAFKKLADALGQVTNAPVVPLDKPNGSSSD